MKDGNKKIATKDKSFHEARLTSPKVQKTIEATSMSLAKYWIIIVPADASAERATPDSIMASDDSFLFWLNIKRTQVVAEAPKKAKNPVPNERKFSIAEFTSVG